MPLAEGTLLGPYRITAPLGAGGMGEVYRARDTRLERTVAIKILPAQFSSDPVRKQRFEREAKTISSLNHPHICTLHDIGSQDGLDYLVMECVEGETLAKRLEKGPLPLEQVLKYGAQIADALDKAHRSSVVHRDLKPGNIMLTASGAKLLDFGLAKPVAALTSVATLTAAVTQSSPMTEQGAIVGTFQYMSPEQVEGKELDGRSDIFSLGAVLYEMLTGQRAFPGKSQLSVASAILEKEPAPISSIKPMTPPVLDHAVKKCLSKDREDRWQSAHDLKDDLEWISQNAPQAAVGRVPSRRQLRMLVTAMVLVVIAVLATAIILANRQPRALVRPLTRFTILLPPGETAPLVTWPSLALSPDGTQLVYAAGRGESKRLYLRSMDRFEVTPLEGSENASSPFFSPDSQWIGFFADGKLKKINLRGGFPMTVCDATTDDRGGSWGPNDTIIFAPGATSGLMRVPASGGTPQTLTSPDAGKGERTHRWPEILPGGKAVVFTIGSLNTPDYFLDAKIAVQSLESGKKEILPVEGTFARYDPAGYLVLAQRGGLFAVPFDLKRLQVTGAPVRILDNVAMDASTGAIDFSLSGTGSFAYIPGGWFSADLVLAWTDRKGLVQPIPAPVRAYGNAHLSPDGNRVAVSDTGRGSEGIWVYDILRGTMMRLTYGVSDLSPLWTPDGKRIAYMEEANRKFTVKWKPADGNGAEETLLPAQNYIQVPVSWSPDGKLLAFSSLGGADRGVRIWIVPLEGDRKPREFVETGSLHGAARFSPDGHWIAYSSDESGRAEVYVQPFPGPGGKWQISTEGGNWPVWARSGRELFYLNGSKIMSVVVTTQPGFAASTPRLLADVPVQTSSFYGGNGEFDVSPDGQHFQFIKAREQNVLPAEVRVVLNWDEGLKGLVRTDKQP
jgi:eukaryotic-like serine/threonine-protein kinase